MGSIVCKLLALMGFEIQYNLQVKKQRYNKIDTYSLVLMFNIPHLN